MYSLLKNLLNAALAVMLSGWLLWGVIITGMPGVLMDVLLLQGSRITGMPTRLDALQFDLAERDLQWSGWIFMDDIAGEKKPLMGVKNSEMRFSPYLFPEWRSTGLLPNPLQIDAVELVGISVDYDIDKRIASVGKIHANLSAKSIGILAQQKDASIQDVWQLLVVQKLSLRDISVRGQSSEYPAKSRSFVVNDMYFSEIGVAERGVSGLDVAERVTRALDEEILRQAELQGINIEKRKLIEQRRSSAARQVSGEGTIEQVDDAQDSKPGVKNAFKAVGNGIRNFGRGVGNGLKKLFKKQ